MHTAVATMHYSWHLAGSGYETFGLYNSWACSFNRVSSVLTHIDYLHFCCVCDVMKLSFSLTCFGDIYGWDCLELSFSKWPDSMNWSCSSQVPHGQVDWWPSIDVVWSFMSLCLGCQLLSVCVSDVWPSLHWTLLSLIVLSLIWVTSSQFYCLELMSWWFACPQGILGILSSSLICLLF